MWVIRLYNADGSIEMLAKSDDFDKIDRVSHKVQDALEKASQWQAQAQTGKVGAATKLSKMVGMSAAHRKIAGDLCLRYHAVGLGEYTPHPVLPPPPDLFDSEYVVFLHHRCRKKKEPQPCG